MSRIVALDPARTEGKTRETLAAVEKTLGGVPNLFRVAAQSPAALEGLVGLSGALARGSLAARVREAIALTVAEANACRYCLSAHAVLGKAAGLSEADIAAARDAAASDPKTAAVLRFARAVALGRGRVTDEELSMLRRAGVSDGEAMEIVAHVVLNVFTNYVNLVAETDIDFPPVTVREARFASAR